MTSLTAAGLRAFLAHTLPAVSASTAVLSRCGFTRVEDVAVDEDLVSRWALRLPSPGA